MIIFFSAEIIKAERLSFDQFYSLVLLYLGENDLGEALDVEELELQLRHVYENPIDWNRATQQQLEDLVFVNAEQIEELLFYADYYGPVRSIGELRLVHDIESPMLLLLPSVLYVGEIQDSIKWKDAFDYTSHSLLLRSDLTCESRIGYKSGHYLGLPFRLLAKYDFEAGSNFRAGVSMESDAGEPWLGYGSRGFDLYRFYAEFSNLKVVDRVIVGSYRAGFGKGLIFGQPSYGGRLSQVLSKNSTSSGVRGYGGISESATLMGVSSNIKLGKFSFTPLYGYSLLDADTSGGGWHSFSKSGYHRSFTEIDRRGTLGLHTLGLNTSYKSRFWHIGLICYGGFFSLPAIQGNDSWSANDFVGDRQWGVSLDYAIKKRSVCFSGEIAISQGLGIATTNTLLIKPLGELQFALNHRYFSSSYHAFWSNTPSSMYGVNGEHGASFALQVPIGGKKSLTFLSDVYKVLYPTIKYSTSQLGYELRSEFQGQLTQTMFLYGSLRYKVTPSWFYEKKQILSLSSLDRVGQFSIKLLYQINACDFTTGVQFNVSQEKIGPNFTDPSFGYLVYQDVKYSIGFIPLRLYARMALYGAPTWANRFYLYESDVPFSGYTPALYGSAFRWYFMVDYKFRFGLTAALRIAQTIYTDRETIGSSYDMIPSSHKTDIHILLSYRINNRKY